MPLQEIRAAAARVEGSVLHTPLISLDVEGLDAKIYLNAENLQSIGSFKRRGAGNSMKSIPAAELKHDHLNGLTYRSGWVDVFDPRFWG